MVLIALSIIVLVLCSRYKQEPMTNSRTGITVTTIITAVITFFELTGVVSLGVMNGIFGGDAFRQMLYDAIASGELDFEDFATANEAMDFAISVVNAVFVVSMIVCILIAAFGIFATVIGFKTMADKTRLRQPQRQIRRHAIRHIICPVTITAILLFRTATITTALLSRIIRLTHRAIQKRQLSRQATFLKTASGTAYAETKIPQDRNSVQTAVRQIRTVPIKVNYKRKIHNHIIKTGYLARFLFSAK